MYECKECGCEFEEPKRLREYLDDHFYETICVCPRCLSDFYEEINEDEEEDVYYGRKAFSI